MKSVGRFPALHPCLTRTASPSRLRPAFRRRNGNLEKGDNSMGWRILGTLVVSLAVVRDGWAQTYLLSETAQAGDCFRIHLDMSLSGEMRVNKEGKAVSLKLQATATHEFPERILHVASDGLPEKAARVYEKAKAVISVDKDPSDRSLRPERRLCVAQRTKDRLMVYSPAGPLTREELELTSEHSATLALPGLLPGRP